MVHIPFFLPTDELTEIGKSQADEALHTDASSSLGELIAIGHKFSTACVQDNMHMVSSIHVMSNGAQSSQELCYCTIICTTSKNIM